MASGYAISIGAKLPAALSGRRDKREFEPTRSWRLNNFVDSAQAMIARLGQFRTGGGIAHYLLMHLGSQFNRNSNRLADEEQVDPDTSLYIGFVTIPTDDMRRRGIRPSAEELSRSVPAETDKR